MSGFREPECPREQLVLWEQRLDDALPVDHPVRHFELLLCSGAFAETFAAWEREYVLLEGKPPYHPRDLAGLYLYGMMNRIRSSRQLECSTYNRLDVIWLMQNQHPDHSTIADFVKKHGKRLRALFRDGLRVLLRAGLVKLEHLAVDGTKVEADAGRKSVYRKASIEAELARVEAQIDALEKAWKENEARESSLFGADAPWSPKASSKLPQALARSQRKAERLQQAIQEISRREAESCAPRQQVKPLASVADPQSRVMRDKEGRTKPNYNAQVAVDAAHGAIVAQDVSDAADDSGQMSPLLEQVPQTCGQMPAEVSADSQYNTGPELAWLEENKVVGHLPDNASSSKAPGGHSAAEIAVNKALAGEALSDDDWAALPRNTQQKISRVAFRYDEGKDEYTCPAGHRLGYFRSSQDTKKWGVVKRRAYGACAACAGCPRASMCYDAKRTRGRSVIRDQYESYRERMRARMRSAAGRDRYRLRRQTVEPRIGQIKSPLGVRRFMRRGLAAVQTEWAMVCTAVNFLIALNHWDKVAAVL